MSERIRILSGIGITPSGTKLGDINRNSWTVMSSAFGSIRPSVAEFLHAIEALEKPKPNLGERGLSLLQSNRRDQDFPGLTKSFKWTEELGKDLHDQFIKGKHPKTSNAELNQCIDHFLFILEKRDKYYGLNEKESIFTQCVLKGPAFAKWCKKSLEYSFLNAHSVSGKKREEEFPIYKHLYEYFPPNYLIHWEETSEDIKRSFMPNEDTSKFEFEFKTALRSLLVKDVEFSMRPEVFKDYFKTTSSYISDKDVKTLHCYQSWRATPELVDKMKCKRCVIPIEPANYRDAVILDLNSLYTILYLNYKIREILRKIPGSLMGHSDYILSQRIQQLMRKAKKENKFFYGRDYKKEGLSRPKNLTKWAVEVLKENYPEEFHYANIFYEIELELNEDIEGIGRAKEKVYPTRGSGLGMANELVTLISCAICEMTLSRVERIYPRIREKIEFGIWNDDSAFIGSETAINLFYTHDFEVHNDLDYELNVDKVAILKNCCWLLGFQSSNVVEMNKEYLFRLAIWDKFFACNIVAAKSFVSSLQFPRECIDSVEELIDYWGYEFYPEEVDQPFSMGGWTHPKVRGVDTTLMSIDPSEISLLLRQYKAHQAIQETPSKLSFKMGEKMLLDKDWNHVMDDFLRLVVDSLKEKTYFLLDELKKDKESIRDRILKSLAMSRRQNDYWRICARLRLAKYKERIRNTNDVHIRLCNEILEEKKGKLLRLPKWTIISEVEADTIINRKNWFPEDSLEANDLDYISLAIGFHRRNEKKEVATARFDLNLNNVEALNYAVNPLGRAKFRAMLPYNDLIDKRLIRWCPNIFIWINDYIENETSISDCKIVSEVMEEIKLPLLPSYEIGTPEEWAILEENINNLTDFYSARERDFVMRWREADKCIRRDFIMETAYNEELERTLLKLCKKKQIGFFENLRGVSLVKAFKERYQSYKASKEERVTFEDEFNLDFKISEEDRKVSELLIGDYEAHFKNIDDLDEDLIDESHFIVEDEDENDPYQENFELSNSDEEEVFYESEDGDEQIKTDINFEKKPIVYSEARELASSESSEEPESGDYSEVDIEDEFAVSSDTSTEYFDP